MRDEPRIGVFVCHCGKNIASSVDVEEVTEYAKKLRNVVYAKDNKYVCSSLGQEEIKEAIKKNNLNRIVIAACSPRMHEQTFRKTLEEAGLNPFLLEIANIREHCSWVHMRDPKATEKAKALVRMAVAKARFLEPFEKKKVRIIPKAMVIGGGVAGIQAALDLAEQGFKVYLVEKEPSLGGHMAQLDKTFPTMDCSICILGPKMVEVMRYENIEVFTYAEIEEIKGYVGNFNVKIRKKARYVNESCTGCGICAKFCPIEVPNEFDLGLANRKAIEIFVLYMDIRAVGKGYEEFYLRAKDMGINFIRGRPSRIVEDENNNLKIFVENTLLGENLEIEAELVVLAPSIVPKNIDKIRKMLNLAVSSDGFLMEAHAKLRPVDAVISGVFFAGCAQSPKDIPSSVAQGSAAASRAATLLAKGEIEVEPIVAYVIPELCFGCEVCKEVCDFNAIDIKWGKAYINELLWTGCGACAAACPSRAIQIRNFTDMQISAQIKEAFKPYEEEPKILAFLCNWCSYAGADTAGLARMQYPANIRVIRVMCSARVDPVFVLKAFASGVDGVLVAGCHLGDCHYLTGNYKAKKRIEKLRSLLNELGIEEKRLRLEWISASEGEKFAKVVKEFTQEIKKLGPNPLKIPKERKHE